MSSENQRKLQQLTLELLDRTYSAWNYVNFYSKSHNIPIPDVNELTPLINSTKSLTAELQKQQDFGSSCKCTAILRDAITGEIVQYEDDAVVTTVGKQRMSDLTNGISTVFFNQCAVGSGSATVATGDTALNAEVARNLVTLTNRNNTQALWETFFTASQAIATITESGLFDSASGGTMLCHGSFNGINKTASTTLTIFWTVGIN